MNTGLQAGLEDLTEIQTIKTIKGRIIS